MALLIGEQEAVIDAKHRLAIGSAFREQIDAATDGDAWVLSLGPDRHLWLYPDKYYGQLLKMINPSPLPSREAARLGVMYGMARLLKADGQGRVVLPERSMQRAVVSERVTLVGNNDHIEIWPADEWERHVDASLPHYGEMLYEAAERLAQQRSAGK